MQRGLQKSVREEVFAAASLPANCNLGWMMNGGKRTNWLGTVLVLMWLSSMHFLFPLPGTSIEALRSGYSNQLAADGDGSTLSNEQMSRAERESNIAHQVDFMKTKIWVDWLMRLLLIAVGIASAIAALLQWKYWGGFTVLMATIWFGAYLLSYQYAELPFFEAWANAAQVSIERGTWTGIVFFWNNLIQPVFFLGAMVYLLYYRPDLRSS